MSECKWTPGPWRVETGKKATRPVVCRIVDAVIKSDDLPSGQSELPDAHLIAAAPELYEELERSQSILLGVQKRGCDCGMYEECGLCKAIRYNEITLAKARGESQ